MAKPNLPIYLNGQITSNIAETPFGGIWEVSIALDLDGAKMLAEGDLIAAFPPCFRYRRTNPTTLDAIQDRVDATDFGYFNEFNTDIVEALTQ